MKQVLGKTIKVLAQLEMAIDCAELSSSQVKKENIDKWVVSYEPITVRVKNSLTLVQLMVDKLICLQLV